MSLTLPKSERLSGTAAVSELLSRGKSGVCGCIRYKYVNRADGAPSRIVVSVPKRNFKRAVKRNLLKRRMREAYRLQKNLLGSGYDIMFVYVPREIMDFRTVFADMTAVLTALASGGEVVETE